jgi:photosystem II stability/assembly factor-like uncharacterized protein
MSIRKILIHIILLLAAYSILPVKYAESLGPPDSRSLWVPVFFGGHSTYDRITYDRAMYDRVYLSSDVNHGWYSDNGGDLWVTFPRSLAGHTVTGFTQSVSNPDTIYSSWQSGLSKTTDRGKTWTTTSDGDGIRLIRPQGYKSVAINSVDPNTIYVGTTGSSGTDGDIFYSYDSGATLSSLDQLPFGRTYVSSVFLSNDNRYLYTAGGGSVETWATGRTYVVNNYVYSGTDYYKCLVGHTSGVFGDDLVSEYWVAVSSRASVPRLKIYDLIGETSSDILLDGSVYGSFNYDIASYTLSGTEHVCVTAGQAIACTSDNGLNWEYLTNTAVTGTNYIYRFDVVNDSGIIKFYATIATDNSSVGTSRSLDGGVTWEICGNTLTCPSTSTPTINGTYCSLTSYKGMRRTIAINPFNTQEILQADDGAVYKSSDSGSTWSTIGSTGANNTVVTDMEFSPNGWLVVTGMDFPPVISRDRGITWTDLMPRDDYGSSYWGHHYAVELYGTSNEWESGSGRIVTTRDEWSSGRSQVHTSDDNGETWAINAVFGTGNRWQGGSSGSDGRAMVLAKCPSNEDIIVAGLDGYVDSSLYGGLWISTNRGVDWAQLNYNIPTSRGWPRAFSRGFGFDPTDSNCQKMVLAGWFGTGTVTTSDRFDTGTYITSWNTNWVNGLQYRPGTSDYYTTSTPDAGSLRKGTSTIKSFNDEDGNGEAILFFGQENKKAVVSTAYPYGDSKIWWTEDITLGASAVWTDITLNFPSRSGANVMRINEEEGDGGFLYVGTSGDGVWKLDLGLLYKTHITGAFISGFSN